MPIPTAKTFSISEDIPAGLVSAGNLVREIRASSIATALDPDKLVGSVGDVLTIYFLDALSAADETTLHGDTTAPAGGILAAHSTTVTSSIRSVEVTNAPNVHVRKPSGLSAGRVYGFSVNFCDKTTWYHDALEVADEAVGSGDGTTTVFNLSRGTNNAAGERIVDLSHGKMSDENQASNPAGNYRQMGSGYGTTLDANLSGYVPIVSVNGIEQTERPYGEISGGDYVIDYEAGVITFAVAPPITHAVVATFWYVPTSVGPRVTVAPSAGKRYMIDRVEIQSSPDACPQSDIVMGVYAGVPPGGSLLARPTVIKNIYDIVNWAYGSRPQVEIQGGASPRALDHKINIHQVRYASEIPLLSSASMYMQVHLAGAVEFSGTWATIVIYGIEEAE